MAVNQTKENQSHSMDHAHSSIEQIGYDSGRGVYYTNVDTTSGGSLCVEVVWVIAEVTGSDPIALEPIASVIDPEAFDTLLSTDSIESLQIAFTYEGWSVTVTADGEITLSESE